MLDSVKDELRDEWKRLVEFEERLRFWKQMVGWKLCLRELAHIGEELKSKFRSKSMKGGSQEKEVIQLMMTLKLKDERRHLREIRGRRNEKRRELVALCNSPRKIKKILKVINGEANRIRKLERRKFIDKANHIRRIRDKEEEEKLMNCPEEINEYKDIIVFKREEVEKLRKEEVEVSVIGDW